MAKKRKHKSQSFNENLTVNVTLPRWMVEELVSGLRVRALFHESESRVYLAQLMRRYIEQIQTEVLR